MSAQIYLFLFIVLCIAVLFVASILSFKVFQEDFKDQIKLDVSLEQMKQSESRIKSFLEENNIEAGTSIGRIAEILKIRQGGTEQGIYNQAYLKEDSITGERIVVFKSGLSEREKNFVFAHEIAHILNGDTIPVTRPVGRNKSQMEQIADYMAAALIMPIDDVFAFLVKNNYRKSSTRKRMALVRLLCKDYKVTELIALRRIKEVYALKVT